MRITTNAMIRNYKSHLQNTIKTMDTARTRVLTERDFSSAMQNPTGALREFQLLRRYNSNETYIENLHNIQSKFDTTEGAIMQISTAATVVNSEELLQGVTGTMGLDERKIIAAKLRETQKTMLLSANASYDNKYVLAGADGQNIPFQLKTDVSPNVLTYRGYDVTTGNWAGTGPAPVPPVTLDELSQESLYVDLGFGLKSQADGSVISSSAFNQSFPGINILGYGKSTTTLDDGTAISKNLIVSLGQLADQLELPDEQFAAAAQTEPEGDFWKLQKEFTNSSKSVLQEVTSLGVKSAFLETTENRLLDNRLTITEQIDETAGIDLPLAMIEYSWAQYANTAAIKIGNSILSSSLIDFMR